MSITSRINEMSTHIEQAYDELQGLGADLTNVNKNIENISMVLDDIYDSMPQVSGEGTSLTLDDTRVGKIKSTLKGNTSQTGTPTPSSPILVNVVSGDNEIKISGGKNQIGLVDLTSTTTSGVTYSISNQVLNINGTSTGKTSIQRIDFNMLSSGSKCFKIIKESGTFTSGAIGLSFRDVNDTQLNFIEISYNGASNTKNIDITNIDHIYLYITNGSAFSNAQIKTMLSDNYSDTYEPYQGNTYNIDLPVENLFDDSTLNNKWVAQNGTITSATGANCIKYNCNANDTYTLSATFGTSSANNIIVMAFYNSSDTLLNRYVTTTNTSLTMTYTAPANTSYMYAGHYGIVATTIQLEKGTKANTYTPYGTTPIELCKIGNYKDYFYKDSDKWYLHKEIGKYIFGSTNLAYDSTYNRAYTNVSSIINNILIPTSNNETLNGLSDYFSISNATTFLGNTSVNGLAISSTGTLSLRNTSYTTQTDYNNWLSTNKPILYYVLATPTNTEITYQPLIDQLNLLEKAQSKENQTNISQINNDLPFIISASALKEWQENTSLNSTLSMVNPLSLGNTLNTQENDIQPIEVDNIEPLEEEENEES